MEWGYTGVDSRLGWAVRVDQGRCSLAGRQRRALGVHGAGGKFRRIQGPGRLSPAQCPQPCPGASGRQQLWKVAVSGRSVDDGSPPASPHPQNNHKEHAGRKRPGPKVVCGVGEWGGQEPGWARARASATGTRGQRQTRILKEHTVRSRVRDTHNYVQGRMSGRSLRWEAWARCGGKTHIDSPRPSRKTGPGGTG